MPLINKLFPAFFNGISEQSDELILDTQCKDMINCIPDIVTGVTRRNGTESVIDLNEIGLASNKFHEYDRGEGDEQYIFIKTSNPLNPIRIFDKSGEEKTVSYVDVATANAYLGTLEKLKALTVQDRTFIVSKDKEVGQTTVTADKVNYTKIAYYWLKRSSNDSNNKYNYAVYLDGTTFQYAHDDSDTAASNLASSINGNANYTSSAIGSVIKIERTDGNDFSFSYWDSWGSQASFGFKGRAGKLSDLPDEMSFDDVYVNITGDDSNEFNDYYVKWTGDSWTEWKDPTETRGTLTNMPIRVDRLSDGTFEVDILEWESPTVGDIDTNPDPSFKDNTIQDIFFHKNRLGFASGDNIILSETGGYYNFYIQTVLEVLDDDPIDVAIASSQASKIYHVKPFQRGLYLFTADSQFELVSEGALSPLTVSLDPVSNYSMDVDVEPIVSGTSLYFISKSSNTKSQLREYLKDEDSLISKGIDSSINVPNLLPSISEMYINSTLDYLVAYSKDVKNTLYILKTKASGTDRVQNAWFKWEFSFNIEGLYLFDTKLYIMKEDTSKTRILSLELFPIEQNQQDTLDNESTTENFSSYIEIPRIMPKLLDVKSPVDNIQLKTVEINGKGTFNVDIYRKSYNNMRTQTYSSGELKNFNASILSRSDDVSIFIKSNGADNFIIQSLSVKGLYRQSSREVK